ncbi:zinc finger, CCHC-type containing protein [Tanacetum coccineum]
MDGAIYTYKARLVAKGFTQTLGVDYEETFSPVADIRAIRILIAITAFYDYEIWQMDIKTDFLNGYLNNGVAERKNRTLKEMVNFMLSYSGLSEGFWGEVMLTACAVDWKSTKQSIFATSSTDAEYIAAFDASKEAVWIRKFISGLGVVPTIEEPINMYCDNTRAIAIAKDHGVTKGARHFRAKVHYLRETIEMGDVRIEKVDTDDNLADPFTKALAFPKHSELTKKIGMIPASSLM